MPRLFLTRSQKSKITAKYMLSPSTLSEVINYVRPESKRHSEIRNYAINHLGAKVFDV